METNQIIHRIEAIFKKYDETPVSYEQDKKTLEDIRKVIERGLNKNGT